MGRWPLPRSSGFEKRHYPHGNLWVRSAKTENGALANHFVAVVNT